MKAIRIKQFGSPEALEYVDCEPPVKNDHLTLIDVVAAAVNPVDYKIREGSHLLCPMLAMPSGIGYDFVGKIRECAKGSTTQSVGDWVLGIAGFPAAPCAYQEQIAIEESTFITVDSATACPDIAALPVAGLTAWQAIHDHGQLKAGQRVLIHAGAGGVGVFAVQLAKLAGAYVLTTASREKHDLLKELGADECIDYREGNGWRDLANIDVVIDLVGGQTGLDSLGVCGAESTLVTVPSMTAKEISEAGVAQGVAVKHFLVDCSMADLKQLLELYEAGKLKPVIDKSLPLSQAPEAHRLIETQRTTGKILLLTV